MQVLFIGGLVIIGVLVVHGVFLIPAKYATVARVIGLPFLPLMVYGYMGLFFAIAPGFTPAKKTTAEWIGSCAASAVWLLAPRLFINWSISRTARTWLVATVGVITLFMTFVVLMLTAPGIMGPR